MSTNNTTEFVHDDLLQIVSSAMANGLVEYVGYAVKDGTITAEVYDGEGDIAGTYRVTISVTEAVAG